MYLHSEGFAPLLKAMRARSRYCPGMEEVPAPADELCVRARLQGRPPLVELDRCFDTLTVRFTHHSRSHQRALRRGTHGGARAAERRQTDRPLASGGSLTMTPAMYFYAHDIPGDYCMGIFDNHEPVCAYAGGAKLEQHESSKHPKTHTQADNPKSRTAPSPHPQPQPLLRARTQLQAGWVAFQSARPAFTCARVSPARTP